MVSVCGDPGMLLPPKILLEGWNFCNRAGRACSEAPRWADCVAPSGVQRVAPADNAAGLPLPAQGQAACDAFTEQKERALGGLCADTGAPNATSYFWTAMLKSGAMNVSERGHLCGLWCANKTPSCNAAAAVSPREGGAGAGGLPAWAAPPQWADANYVMRQPRVAHEWTVADGGGGWRGSFYGTLDEAANLTALPTPSELIEQVLAPKRPGCSLAGTWLGQGDARLVIAVAQAPQAPAFTARCTWLPGPGLPAPWNASGAISNMSVVLHLAGHSDEGVAVAGEGRSADLVCWSAASYWCRDTACDGGAAARCAAAVAAPTPPISSYFGMEWVTRGGRRVHRHVLRTGDECVVCGACPAPFLGARPFSPLPPPPTPPTHIPTASIGSCSTQGPRRPRGSRGATSGTGGGSTLPPRGPPRATPLPGTPPGARCRPTTSRWLSGPTSRCGRAGRAFTF